MNRKTKILVADDSEINRAILADILTPDYDIIEAADGEEAIACLNKCAEEIALVLLDIVMPKMDGFEVLAIMNRDGMLNSIPVIIVSAETADSYIDHAYNLGAAEYISRPFHKGTVRHRIENTVKLYAKQKHLESIVTEQILEKEKNNVIMVDILSHIVEFRNGESGLHVLHIRTITEILLRELSKTCKQYNLTPAKISLITNASALHDIGKISIDEEILNKPAKLTLPEFQVIKEHSYVGAKMLGSIAHYQEEELLQTARDICHWHHERYDGGGYPDGLKGEEIPIAAQVVSLADVYDALTSKRVYKPAYSHEKAIEMILNGECGVFNPLLIDALMAVEAHLDEEVKVRSAGRASRDRIHALVYDTIQSYSVSDRTLDLLEQERTKYQFYASLTKELQFEYTYATDTLFISEWGAAELGVDESIPHPRGDGNLIEIFAEGDFEDFCGLLRQATPENPIVSKVYRLNIKGDMRWYKVLARPIWGMEENALPTKIIGKFIDNEEEQSRLEKLTVQAHHDDLTGLLGRNRAFELISERLAVLKNKKAAILILDVDTFKNMNDSYGHFYGDKVLKAVAKRLKESLHRGDIAARIGGDEFLAYIETADSVERLVEQIFKSVCGSYEGIDISVSMGIACTPQQGSSYKELFLHADQALYACKHAGKSMYKFYEDSMKNILSSHSVRVMDDKKGNE